MMKKIITIILACLLVLTALAACRDPETPESTGTNGTVSADPTGTTAAPTHSALEDSIFDDPTAQTSAPPEVTEDNETTPNGTEPSATTEPTQPGGAEDATEPSKGEGSSLADEYAHFQAMSGTEQMAYQQSFGEGEAGLEAFFDWYNAAREAYEKEHPPIEIGGDGVIDMDDLFGGQ